MVLSFHPCIEGEVNLICAGRDPGPAELSAIRAAEAVILPQGCRASLYRMARRHCSRVFPNYDARFEHPGKTGQIRLFRDVGAPHPESILFEDARSCLAAFENAPPMAFPLVFKFDWGGEGKGVFPFDSPEALCRFLGARLREPAAPCLVQALVPGGERTLRVAVIGREIFSYWRVAGLPDGFYTNVSRGGVIDPASDMTRQSAGKAAVREFCRKTGVNLAGFDLIFPGKAPGQGPLFLEINYFFGRRGLGGSEAFYRILQKEVRRWLSETESR